VLHAAFSLVCTQALSPAGCSQLAGLASRSEGQHNMKAGRGMTSLGLAGLLLLQAAVLIVAPNVAAADVQGAGRHQADCCPLTQQAFPCVFFVEALKAFIYVPLC